MFRVLSFLLSLCAPAGCASPDNGGAAITRPFRVPVLPEATGLAHEEFRLQTRDGLTLRGWLFRPQGAPRGLVVFFHGRDVNRHNADAAVKRLVPRGFAVLAYDQRAHGESDGDHTTYGFHEKQDAWDAITQVGIAPVFVIGHSLGGGIALQAATDPRVKGAVALAPFADLDLILRDVAGESLASILPPAIDAAERTARFQVSAVSPRRAAASLHIPVLLFHGNADWLIDQKHSDLIARDGPPTLRYVRVEGGNHHAMVLYPQVWERIIDWLEPLAPAVAAQKNSDTEAMADSG